MAFLPKHRNFLTNTVKSKSYFSTIIKIFIAVYLPVLIILMYPQPESYIFDYKVGAIWNEQDLIAPFSYPVFKDKNLYEKEIQKATEEVIKVFYVDESKSTSIQESLKLFFNYIKSIPSGKENAQQLVFNSDLQYLVNQAESIKTQGLVQDFEKIYFKLKNIIANVYDAGIISISKSEISNDQIAIRRNRYEDILPIGKFWDVESVLEFIEEQIEKDNDLKPVKEFLKELISYFLQPNIIYDQQETEKLVSAAIENIPKTIGFVQQNEKIISKHERITEDIKLKLESLKDIQLDKQLYEKNIIKLLGVVLHSALIILLFAVYLYLFRKKVFDSNKHIFLISIIILIQVFFSYLVTKIPTDLPIQYLVLLPASAMLLTILFDSRIAFFGSVVMAFLVAMMLGHDYEMALTLLVSATLASYTVRNIRQRTQIFRSMIFIFLGLTLTITAFSLQKSEPIYITLQKFGFALLNSIFSSMLTYGLLIIFEKSFKITTDLTLMELSDPNHPLLKILREKTPGTYHHSVMLGSLSEAAADAIGANPILARVGAYYHDIGKTLKPEYFIENEFQKKSKHQRLTPRMSARIIISHVKDGIELARSYGLPEALIDFIPQHHGTTRLSYFFDKALRQTAARKTRHEVNEADYRYPGPKPQSREAAIVMLADIVEAFTRTLPDLTPDRLESAIDERIKMRFIEGQLDECDLTLRDLTKIKQAFLNILIGTYHQRIKYPTVKLATEEVEVKTANVETSEKNESQVSSQIKEDNISDEKRSDPER